MTKEIKADVVRQALIEYLAHRCCVFSTPHPDPWELNTGLRNYVNRRYASQDDAFKTRKIEWLTPRIKAVYDLLEEMREGA